MHSPKGDIKILEKALTEREHPTGRYLDFQLRDHSIRYKPFSIGSSLEPRLYNYLTVLF